MQKDARSSLVRGVMVPRRNDLMVNQSKTDARGGGGGGVVTTPPPPPNRWSFPQEETPVTAKKRKTSNVEGYRLLNVNILEGMVASLSCSRMF